MPPSRKKTRKTVSKGTSPRRSKAEPKKLQIFSQSAKTHPTLIEAVPVFNPTPKELKTHPYYGKQNGAAPTDFTRAWDDGINLWQRCIDAAATGMFLRDVATLAGTTTHKLSAELHRWPLFDRAYRWSELLCQQMCVGAIIGAAANGDWRAGAWYLERRNPRSWGQRRADAEQEGGLHGNEQPKKVTISIGDKTDVVRIRGRSGFDSEAVLYDEEEQHA